MLDYWYYGARMQQQDGAIDGFNKLLNLVRPVNIIELGTGMGGLAVMFTLYSRLTNTNFMSIEYNKGMICNTTFDLLSKFGVLLIGDIFILENEIKDKIQQSGITLLLCDNGDKKKEFNLFAPYLKSGDIIMAHDYWNNRESFQKDFIDPGNMGCCEITFDDIYYISNKEGLIPFMQDTFTLLQWVCRRKQ